MSRPKKQAVVGKAPLPRVLEDSIDKVVQQVADQLEKLVDDFMQDGPPFQGEKLSEPEQVRRYVEMGVRDDPNVAFQWLQQKHDELSAMMKSFGADDAMIQSAHLWDITVVNGLKWSAKMEKLLGEHLARLPEWTQLAEEPAPFTPQMPVGMNDGSLA